MLTLKDFPNVLVSYLNEPDQLVAKVDYLKLVDPQGNPVARAVLETIKGGRRGVVVAIGPGIVGWSLCHTKAGWGRDNRWHEADKFNKAKGLDLALQRAKISATLDLVGKTSFYQKVPFSIQKEFDKMVERSFHYFQIPDETEE